MEFFDNKNLDTFTNTSSTGTPSSVIDQESDPGLSKKNENFSEIKLDLLSNKLVNSNQSNQHLSPPRHRSSREARPSLARSISSSSIDSKS